MGSNGEATASALVREKLGEQMGATIERLEEQAAEARELRGQVVTLKGNAEELSAKVGELSEAVRELSSAADEKLKAKGVPGRG